MASSFEKGKYQPLTPNQRKERSRALKAGKEDPYSDEKRAVLQEIVTARQEEDARYAALRLDCQAFDATGARYLGECRRKEVLLNLFLGLSEAGDTDEETGDGEKKDEKSSRPNPSQSIIRIQNSHVDPTKGKGKGKRKLEEIDFEVNGRVDFEKWLDLRDRARKDLFWLGRLLGKGLYRSVHQVICNQFVPKNFGGEWLDQFGQPDPNREPIESMYFEGYTLDDFHQMIEDHQAWRDTEMMLLDSRGFYKSTIDGLDSVQWLLACPDVRVLIITGEYKLALKFLGEIKKYFHLGEGYEPTAFHLLFPEYILFGKEGTSETPLKCPARLLNQGEPSLWVNSIVANLSGWHCDLKKGDDVVTDENSNNEEQREKLKAKYDGTNDLLDPHGFTDHIGTRYFTKDWYGMRLDGYKVDDEGNMFVQDGRLVPDGQSENVAPIKYFCRGCWKVKPEYKYVPLAQLQAHMVDLTFPARWTFDKLRNLLFTKMAGTGSDRGFRNQQLNIPTDESEIEDYVRFDEKDIRAHMYQREAAPKAGDIYIVWDWALSDRKTSDYSVGVVARLYRNDNNEWSFVILEIVCDKWKHNELAYQIVSLSKRWAPKVTMIEQSNAADMLKDEIERVGHRVGFKPYIFWKQPSRQENAKRNRIKSLQILLSEHRLHFVTGSWIDEMIKQFTSYTGEKKNRGRKDDIPDACSYLTYILPIEARPHVDRADPEEEKRIEEEQYRQSMKHHTYNRYFGTDLLDTRWGSNRSNPQAKSWKQWLGSPDAKPEPATVAAPKPQDPRMTIFGNKGPWRL